MGNPTLAGAAKGRKMRKVMIEKMTEFIETINNTPPDRLYQNRY